MCNKFSFHGNKFNFRGKVQACHGTCAIIPCADYVKFVKKIVPPLQGKQRRGGLVVSALVFRSGGRWFKPDHCRRVVSLDKKLYFVLSLFTQVYKWVLAIIMLGVTLRWTSIPSRGSSNIPSHFMLRKPELSAGLLGHLAHMQTLPFTYLPLQGKNRLCSIGLKKHLKLGGHCESCP